MASKLSLNHREKLALAFDTSTSLCTVALGTTSKLYGEVNILAPRAHMEKLLPSVDKVLKASGCALDEVETIIVGIGSGSFTGLRIGVATARALAQVLRSSIVGVPSLDVLAYQFLGWNKLICSVVDAKRGEVYAAVYLPAKTLERLTDYMVVTPSALSDFLASSFKGKSLILTGDGLEPYGSFLQNKMSGNIFLANSRYWYPQAAYLLPLGLARLEEGKGGSFFDLRPLYVRLSQAEEICKKKKAEKEMRRLNIAPMDFRHLGEVLQIEKQSFPAPWTRSMFIEGISRGKMACYLVALIKKKVVGYGGLEFLGREGHITNMAVAPDWRRDGIASRLLVRFFKLALDRGAKRLVLEVRESNVAAHRLYQKFGFRKLGVHKNYYSDTGESALILGTGDIRSTRYRSLLVNWQRSLDWIGSGG